MASDDSRPFDPVGEGDGIVPFQIEGENIRGRLIRLGSEVDAIVRQHDYPPVVSRLVCEAVALVSLIGSGMKFDGRLTLQSRGSGPVSIVVADYVTPGRIRAYARFDENALPQEPRPDVRTLLGEGHLTMTLDQGPDMELYQGVVALEGASLSDCAIEYLHRSEQVESVIRLAAAEVIGPGADTPSWRVGGLMVQHLAGTGAPFLDEDAERFERAKDDPWHRSRLLAESVEDHELIDPMISHERLIYRLFHEDGVRASAFQPIRFSCTCSRERVERVLRQYDDTDYADMIEDGMIRARCEFCSREYAFSPSELVRSTN